MPVRTWTSDEVAALVASTLDVAARRVETVAGSVTNQDFAVDLVDGSRVLVKIGVPDQLIAEAWALPRAADLGLSVPRVRALDETQPVLIISWVSGRPSTDVGVLGELGRQLRLLHTCRLPGYGPLEIHPDGAARGRFTSWSDYLDHQLLGLTDLVPAGLLTPAVAGEVRNWVDRFELRGFADVGVLLHGDLKEVHLLAEDGVLRAIIDWGDPTAGEPRIELARISMMGEPALAAVLAGYGWQLTPELTRILAGYRLVWNVGALAYEFRAGGDWFDAYRDRVHTDLAWLGRNNGH